MEHGLRIMHPRWTPIGPVCRNDKTLILPKCFGRLLKVIHMCHCRFRLVNVVVLFAGALNQSDLIEALTAVAEELESGRLQPLV